MIETQFQNQFKRRKATLWLLKTNTTDLNLFILLQARKHLENLFQVINVNKTNKRQIAALETRKSHLINKLICIEISEIISPYWPIYCHVVTACFSSKIPALCFPHFSIFFRVNLTLCYNSAKWLFWSCFLVLYQPRCLF